MMTKINTKDIEIPTTKQYLGENRINPFGTKMEWYSCIFRDRNNYKNMTCLQEVIKKSQLCLPEILQGPISLRITLALLKHQDAIYSSVPADCHIIRASLVHYAACRWCSSESATRLGQMQDFSQCRCQFPEPETLLPACPKPQAGRNRNSTFNSQCHWAACACREQSHTRQNAVFLKIIKSPGWFPGPN